MNLDKRQQGLAILAVGMLAILALDRFLVTPLTAAWKDRSDRIRQLDQAVTQGAMLLDREDAIRERWDSMQNNMLPVNESAAENEALKAFDRWSRNSRISIASIQPQWTRGRNERTTLECRADGFGGLEALARFLHELETDPLAFHLLGLEIVARDNSGDQLSLAVRVSALLQEEPAP